jgi:hypothetical protein
MDPTSVAGVLKILAAIGPTNLVILMMLPGGLMLVVVVAILIPHIKLIHRYREDMQRALAQAEDHQQELRRMYENNVVLVEQAQRTADSLQTTIVKSTAAMSELAVLIRTNQYCPYVRLEKQAKGPQL